MSKKEYKRKIKELEKRDKKGYELSSEENEMLREYYWNQLQVLTKWLNGLICAVLIGNIIKLVLTFIDIFC